MRALRRAALIVTVAGAAISLALTLYAGRHNKSVVLVLLFAVWVLSPFIAAIAADSKWNAQRILHGAMLVFTLASVALYAGLVSGYYSAKTGFVFLVVPLASWLVVIVAVAIALLRSR